MKLHFIAIAVLVIFCVLLPMPALARREGYAGGYVPTCPGDFRVAHGPDFDICCDRGIEKDAIQVAGDVEQAYVKVSTFFDNVSFRPKVIIASSHREYEGILGISKVPNYSIGSGWGDGNKSVIVIKSPELAPIFKTVIAHEMTHIATRSYIRGYKYALPDWFSEGLAVYVSGDLPPDKRRAIESRCMEGKLMSIEELDRVHRFHTSPGISPGDVGAAYTQSGLLAEFIANRYGNRSLLSILDSFGPCGSLDTAFVSAIGKTPESVNLDWQNELKAGMDGGNAGLYGHIVDHHGMSMPNETVSFTALRNDSPARGMTFGAVSNDAGYYELKVACGPLKITSEKPGYEVDNGTIALARNESRLLNITLNGSALETAMARAKEDSDLRNMIYAGLVALAIVIIVAAYARSRKK